MTELREAGFDAAGFDAACLAAADFVAEDGRGERTVVGFDEAAASAASATGFAIGVSRGELRDVLRAELVERRDAEQLHRALDLAAQDRDRPVDAARPPAMRP